MGTRHRQRRHAGPFHHGCAGRPVGTGASPAERGGSMGPTMGGLVHRHAIEMRMRYDCSVTKQPLDGARHSLIDRRTPRPCSRRCHVYGIKVIFRIDKRIPFRCEPSKTATPTAQIEAMSALAVSTSMATKRIGCPPSGCVLSSLPVRLRAVRCSVSEIRCSDS